VAPSVWAEQHRNLVENTSMPGAFRFENSPYAREILDCFAPSHPSRVIAVMKAAQIGFSTSVIENAIGWIISQDPGNILYLVGHEDLVKDSMNKVELMIDSCGIRHLIRSSVQRSRNNKSGDTDHRKEFAGGYLKVGQTNHKSLRNISMRYGFVDDFEAMKAETDKSGSTKQLIEQRFAAFARKMKLAYISSPEVKSTSNIEPVYLDGDQRKYHIPCPCCHQSELDTKEKAGMTWRLDDSGRLDPDSVGYTCYKCGGFFNDHNKDELIRRGAWVPSARPVVPDCYSYQISALYAPSYMYGWEKYVRAYIEANPIGEKRNEAKWKSFVNLVLGETYEQAEESVSANQLQKNIRNYEIGTIPGKLAQEDGNGKIVLVTLAADCNGKEDDARIDYEIVAWSESGATYSVQHGSIGTFIPKDPGRVDRKRWSYQHGVANSVWPEFQRIVAEKYTNDLTGKRLMIFLAGIDTGHFTSLIYPIVDTSNGKIISLKGKDMDKYVRNDVDLKTFKQSREKGNLYLVEGNVVKDELAEKMRLTWNPKYQEAQPAGFMNFPLPSGGLYLFENYFAHFESEHKVLDKDTMFRWVKKSQNHQNHLWDCRLYNMVVKDIFLAKLFRESGIKNGIWADYVDLVLSRKKK
jgi:phage terminase large subunit GpA-like protein